MKKKYDVICCPSCGMEYLPAEIFMPKSFMGTPSCIERDAISHEILDFNGLPMDTEESYICDNCKTPFIVTAKVTFSVREDLMFNTNKPTVTKITNNDLF